MPKVKVRTYSDTDRRFVIGLEDITQREMRRLDPDRHPPVRVGEAERWFDFEIRKSRSDRTFILIAEVDGDSAGFVFGGRAGEPWTRGGVGRPPKVMCGEIYELHVLPNFRRRGVASALLRQAEIELARRGCGEIVLEHLARNKAAWKFYAAHGYEPRNVVEVKRVRRAQRLDDIRVRAAGRRAQRRPGNAGSRG